MYLKISQPVACSNGICRQQFRAAAIGMYHIAERNTGSILFIQQSWFKGAGQYFASEVSSMKTATLFITKGHQLDVKRQRGVGMGQLFQQIQSHYHPQWAIKFTSIHYGVHMRSDHQRFGARQLASQQSPDVPDVVYPGMQACILHPGLYGECCFSPGAGAEG